jgi:hypothetical protein
MFYVKQAKTSANSSVASFSRRDVTMSSSLVSQSELVTSISLKNLSIAHYAGLLQTSQSEFNWISNTNPFQRLRNLLTLEDNWDGYGAPKFSRDQISRAFDLYSSIYSYYLEKEMNFSQLAPFIAPNSDGSILFEWAGQRFQLKELEIFVPSTMEDEFEYLKCNDDQDEAGKFSIEDINALLNWLFVTER